MIKVGDAVILRPDYEDTLGVEECLGDRFMFSGDTPPWLVDALRGASGTVEKIHDEGAETFYVVRFTGNPGESFWLTGDEILPAPPADRVL